MPRGRGLHAGWSARRSSEGGSVIARWGLAKGNPLR
jgi:hypothetical protein